MKIVKIEPNPFFQENCFESKFWLILIKFCWKWIRFWILFFGTYAFWTILSLQLLTCIWTINIVIIFYDQSKKCMRLPQNVKELCETILQIQKYLN